ncbi:FMN-binding protein [Carnobacteriaceae bacterium 52-44]
MGEKTSLTLKIIVASLFTMLIVTFVFTDTFSFGESDSGASGDAPADALVGTAEGHNGPLTVAVTMDGDTITDVTVTEHAETEGLADPAIEEVPAAIVENNSTDVDTVSGATVTSNAIMSAVEDAVSGGGATGGDSETSGDAVVETVEGHNGPLTVEVTMDGDTITDVTVTEHSETEGLADPALEEVPAAIVESNSTDVDTVSGATVTSNAIIEAVNAVLNGSNDEAASEPVEYTDGTYEGTADGHNDSLSVEVTVENGEISDIVITDHAETEGIADPAFEEVPAAIMESNSTDVDTVSGATVTSNAIMSAVENALEDAQ